MGYCDDGPMGATKATMLGSKTSSSGPRLSKPSMFAGSFPFTGSLCTAPKPLSSSPYRSPWLLPESPSPLLPPLEPPPMVALTFKSPPVVGVIAGEATNEVTIGASRSRSGVHRSRPSNASVKIVFPPPSSLLAAFSTIGFSSPAPKGSSIGFVFTCSKP